MSKSHRHVEKQNKVDNVSQSPASPTPPPADGGEQNDGGDGASKRTRNTKCEQQPTDWAPRVTAACTVALVVITWFYTHYAGQQADAAINAVEDTHRAADAAKSSSETAAKTLEMDRPYISVDVVPTSDLEFTPDGHGYLRLGSTVVNYGRSPALNARIWAQFLSQAKGSPSSATDPMAFCENLGKEALAAVNGGTYFPQVPYRASWIGDDQGAARSVAPKLFMSTFIACVAYQSPFSKDWLYTGKTYWVVKARHGKLGGTMGIARGEKVLQRDLVLAPAMTTISK